MTAVAADERPLEHAPSEIVLAMGGTVPTAQQWRALSYPLRPCAVVAGAGSGKTAVMAARVVYLALVHQGRIEADHDGALPSQVLCLTFTNKAAEELSRRVRDATAGLGLPEGEEATVLTYHAFAARLLDEYGLRIRLEREPMLLSEAHKWQLASSLLEDREFEHLEVRSVAYVVRQALGLADQCANHLCDPDVVGRESEALADRAEVRSAADREMLLTALRRAELAGLVSDYRTRKRELNAIDYGDQISLAHRLVTDRTDVVEEFRSRFPVVLLDEYQDTNISQARLLEALCGPGYPVFAVGDPDQNIYAWRGASLRNILRFGADFGATEDLPLYVNFRSGSRILAVAQRVIEEVPEERRAANKVLRPHALRGEGRVAAFLAGDERSEGRHIARLLREEADRRAGDGDAERRWQDFAVLCRKKRLFAPIAEALRGEGIPVEVVDLGGLLQLPEIVDVVAWLRVLEDPGRNVALARILQGPRWRIGYRDLVALARWSSRNNARLRGALAGEEDTPGDVVFALAEALDHLDDPEMTGLSDEARERLREFAGVLASLRKAGQGSLGDLVAEIIESSGLLPELEASMDPAAAGARRNLLNFLQHVSAFSPLEGEASLSTLVSYLDLAEETEDSEFEPVQLSDANTVKLLTIHKAKGLEWDVVFVPGLAEHDRIASSIFPDVSRQPNPVRQPQILPFDLRGDADVLPRYEGNINRFRDQLRERALEEERRLCYVALTRARDQLVVSAARWYEGPSEGYRPGRFYEEVRHHPDCEVLFEEEAPEENPLVEARRARVPTWPLPPRADDTDDLFTEGWHRAALEEAAAPGWAERRAASLSAPDRAEFRQRLDADVERASLIEVRSAPDRRPVVPSQLSATSILDYARCPKLFYWAQVRPLPRRPNPAARLGSEVHRWIELESRGQATLLDVDDGPDLSTEERLTDPTGGAALRQAFKESRFWGKVPLYTERPFLLYLDGMVVGGRIDAIFGDPDGAWEVVDYKTGRVHAPGDPLAGLQLDLYALACTEVWGKRPEDLTLTYVYLREGTEVTRSAGDPAATRRGVLEALSGIAEGRFDPTPGDQCHWCDFLSFCDAGRAHVASRRQSP